ncbi:MAG: TonB-dependent receptor plug domain-containing protein, partial [Acidaminococcaceae bacterium]|nr:TonB-dependent receptor plug domain-containing protein [Acidaminococcaceae bacterium]
MYRRQGLEKKIVITLLLGLSCVGTAYAEKVDNGSDTPSFDLEAITVEAKRPDWESKLSPGTVTVIRPDDYKGEQKDLPELLKMVPGVHVRQLMGKGQYTTVSVRGSTAAQVGVFVDGVLYNLGGDAAVDISTIPVKNVERIEVYRGYIPARFGGTYIGGVINIVTKRPTKADVSASFGKSSYGGYKGSLQVDAPLGSGSLMVGLNREQSDGDFKYKNYYSDTKKAEVQTYIDQYSEQIRNFDTESINSAYSDNLITETEKEYYLANQTSWNTFVDSGGLTTAAAAGYASSLEKILVANTLTDAQFQAWWNDFENRKMVDNILKVAQIYLKLDVGTLFNLDDDNEAAWKAFTTDPVKYLASYAEEYGEAKAAELVSAISHSSTRYQGLLKELAEEEALKKKLGDGNRYRKYNDYKNTDFIAKWQDDHWLTKFTWKQIDRHLPSPLLWCNSPAAYVDTGLLDYVSAARKQKLTSKELLVGRRDTVGNLEWGWNVNYLNQGKQYKCENWEELDALNPNNIYSGIPMRKWSAYNSKRWGGAVDGTYKAGDKNLLEFMVNYSDESMHVGGSLITDGTLQTGYSSANRYRTNYDQKLLNLQLQDTITLNEKGDLWLTPSIRYNRSEINSGRAVGWNNNAGTPAQWMFEAIDQTDS